MRGIITKAITENKPELIINALGGIDKTMELIKQSKHPCFLFETDLDCENTICKQCLFNIATGANIDKIKKWLVKEQPIVSFEGLKIGDTLDSIILTKWSKLKNYDNTYSVGNKRFDSIGFTAPKQSIILNFDKIRDVVVIEIGNVGALKLRAKGLKAFIADYIQKREKEPLFAAMEKAEMIYKPGTCFKSLTGDKIIKVTGTNFIKSFNNKNILIAADSVADNNSNWFIFKNNIWATIV
jgi:hypothetical protein